LGASGAGLNNGEQFIPTSFVINTKPLEDAGVPVEDKDVEVSINGPKGPVPVTISKNPDGNYEVKVRNTKTSFIYIVIMKRFQYVPVDAGKHNIAVAVKDQPIVNANATINKTSCNASGPGLQVTSR